MDVGIGVGVAEMAEIERDQFVYFVTMTRYREDPRDWPLFRRELLAALTAAYGLNAVWTDREPADERRRVQARLSTALAVIDAARQRHDPAVEWDAFFDALWARRGPLMERSTPALL